MAMTAPFQFMNIITGHGFPLAMPYTAQKIPNALIVPGGVVPEGSRVFDVRDILSVTTGRAIRAGSIEKLRGREEVLNFQMPAVYMAIPAQNFAALRHYERETAEVIYRQYPGLRDLSVTGGELMAAGKTVNQTKRILYRWLAGVQRLYGKTLWLVPSGY